MHDQRSLNASANAIKQRHEMENRALDSRNDYGFGPSTDYDDVSNGGNSNFGWNMFLFAVAVAMVAVNWGFLRPASRQLDQMQAHIRTLEKSVAQLTAQKEGAAKASNLLALLQEQGRRTELASASLVRIQQLHNRLVNETGRYNDAAVALDRLSALRADVAAQGKRIEEARSGLNDIAQLQRQLLRTSSSSDRAKKVLDRLEAVQTGIAQAEQSVNHAESLVADMGGLHRQLLSTNQLHEEAYHVMDRLIDMSETLVDERPYTTDASVALNDLIALRQSVDAQSVDIAKSHKTLDHLVELKDDVLGQTDGIADAILTLERTADLNAQFQLAAESFESWRRWLTEVVMMEPTVRRAMQSLEPLTALGNLRRVSPDELRKAAAVVANMREIEIATAKSEITRQEEMAEIANASQADATH